MDVFDLRSSITDKYQSYVSSFVQIQDRDIRQYVTQHLNDGTFWPEPLVQLNPNFRPGNSIDDLVLSGHLHPDCTKLFAVSTPEGPIGLHLHQHQREAITLAHQGKSYVVTTGTGSGKSLTYIIPIVDRILRDGPGQGIRAIVVYPMNALANSQYEELAKFLGTDGPVTFKRYTGQESAEEKSAIINNPPDILLTNYMMLELILTRHDEARLVESARNVAFIVFDELHTYRGRQGADVALLIRRLRDRLETHNAICVGTSATMSSSPSFDERQASVAEVASRIFGIPIDKQQVIGETLEQVTFGPVDPEALRTAINRAAPEDFENFVRDPVATWLEQEIGLRMNEAADRLERTEPRQVLGVGGLAEALHEVTQINMPQCHVAIKQRLLRGNQLRHPTTQRPVFAFRLHQFISKASTVYAPLATPAERLPHLTLNGQVFAPDSGRQLRLYPLEFCRNCGQEYYSVRRTRNQSEAPGEVFVARGGTPHEEDSQDDGYLYLGDWPSDEAAMLSRLPDAWLEDRNGTLRLKSSYKRDVPEIVHVNGLGEVLRDGGGLRAAFVGATFKFCLCCGVNYTGRTNRLTKLASLSSEGRSTATTLLSMAAVQGLRNSDLPERARKILSFTDNRQDASLQAGHFNDFVFVAALRAGLAQALQKEPLEHDTIAKRVFEAMQWDFTEFAADPNARFRERDRTIKVAQDLIGYALYSDLAEGKRITLPNLEGVDLVRFDYPYLLEVCQEPDLWARCHPALSEQRTGIVEVRLKAARALLDWMRSSLAIKIPYLDREWLQTLMLSMGLLREDSPLYLPADEQTKLESGVVVALGARSSERGKSEYDVLHLSGMSALGKYLMRPETLLWREKLNRNDAEAILTDLVLALSEFVERVDDNAYQLKGTAFTWQAGPGLEAHTDALRVVRTPDSPKPKVNTFFLDLYRNPPGHFKDLRSAEHTAQIKSDEREIRETEFRQGKLPVLFCSPTMELGVDISDLNVVHMRNVPPTPANYAQRSGRAGRSGQPALVMTYATTGNNHDQYFFRRPTRMVSGAVKTPRIDLANEALVRSHIHAIWLAETGKKLPGSLADLLETGGDQPSLEVVEDLRLAFESELVQQRALHRAEILVRNLGVNLHKTSWYSPEWLPYIVKHASREFNRACDRWRDLYRSALSQLNLNNGVLADSSKRHLHDTAKRLHGEAQSQLELLRNQREGELSDFYTYRYLASEGFLPGYNFARLPLSAYIPGRRTNKGQPESYLSRPRFLAVSEFGPNAIIYHNGAKYEAHKVIVPARGETSALPVVSVQRCERCGYLHHTAQGGDLCERCHARLAAPQPNLFRMTSVATRRRERIGSDEEERRRVGFEIKSGLRFASRNGVTDRVDVFATHDHQAVLQLTYGDGATLWRINYGWRNRANKHELGFLFDPETSQWLSQKGLEEKLRKANGRELPVQRVIPFVEDTRNVLLIAPTSPTDAGTLVTLMSALKNAIQLVYQLEDSELGAEVLPDAFNPQQILLFEASEGGAGVLIDLVMRPKALAETARRALELLHFDPDTGEDRGHAPHAKERCVAACYDCLMTYSNQSHHEWLDRFKARDTLLALTHAQVHPPQAQGDHLAHLFSRCESSLEREWLQFLTEHQLRLPTQAQQWLPEFSARPDFTYADQAAVVFIDGPVHEVRRIKERDATVREALDMAGFTVVTFTHDTSQWPALAKRYKFLFGEG